MAIAACLPVDDPGHASVLLDPLKQRILEMLREPKSATEIARDLGKSRQRIGYHVRQLEAAKLIRSVHALRKGNCLEKKLQAVAKYFVISADALGGLAPDSTATGNHFSSACLVAAASRSVQEVARLADQADRAGKSLPTLTLDVDLEFESASEQREFANQLSQVVAELARKYAKSSDGNESAGQTFRLVVSAYPKPAKAC